MIAYIPDNIIWIFPAYWEFPIPFIWVNVWVGELYNIFFVVVFFLALIKHRKNMLYFKNGMFKKNNTIMIWGQTWEGKTRLMTEIAKETYKKDNNIVITNFYSAYTDFAFASFDDFKRLQTDIWYLSQKNFSIEEKNKINALFPWYFNKIPKEIKTKMDKIQGAYNFVTLSDEFYAYLYARTFMKNFSGEDWQKLMLDLHQTRHHEQTLILTAQETEHIDKDMRDLAHNEIEVKTWLLWFLYWFNVLKRIPKNRQTPETGEYIKVNRLPYIFINYYEIKKVIDNLINIILLTKWRKKEKCESKLFKNKILDYYTKFDVNTSINIYKQWKLFDYLIQKEKVEFEKKQAKANETV